MSALGINVGTQGAFLAGCLRGQGLLIDELGSSFPLDIVSTVEERALVSDESWRQDGMALDVPEPEIELAPSEIDAELLYERLQRERESDEVLVS